MGYSANTTDVDFVIPADKVADALAAVNEKLETQFTSLDDMLHEYTGFDQDDTEVSDEHGFTLGGHKDKYCSYTDEILTVLGQFATDGSYVRLIADDDSLFGFRVVDGRLRTETGDYTWTLDPEPRS